jgi:hypothetical protein
MQRTTCSTAIAALVAVGLLSLTSPARADHSLYVGGGIGPYWDFDGNGYGYSTHGRFLGEFGWHFSGNDTGFMMAAEAALNFGPDYFGFLGGLRLGGDIAIHEDSRFTVMLRPSGLIGLSARNWGPAGNRDWWGQFVLQPAFDVRFVLLEHQLAIWARPVAIDVMFWWDQPGAKGFWVSGAYQALVGIDYQF